MPTRPGRGKSIADIAHLYLSSSDRRADDDRPADGESQPVLKLTEPTEGAVQAAAEVVAVAWEHLGPAAANGAHVYAEHLARAGQRVAVVTVDAAGAAVRLLQRADESPPQAVEALRGDGLLGEPEQLERLMGLVDRLVIRVGCSLSDQRDVVLSQADSICVLVDCQPQALATSYQTMKALARQWPAKPMCLFAVDAISAPEAEAAARRLADLAERFLGREVRCEGWSLRSGAIRSQILEHHQASGNGWAAQWLDKLGQFIGRRGSGPHRDGEAQVETELLAGPEDATSPVTVKALTELGQPIRNAEDMYRFACNRAAELEADQADLVLQPPDAPAGLVVRVLMSMDGARTAVVASCGDGRGSLEAGMAALEWAGRVVRSPPETGRRILVACADAGESLRSIAGGGLKLPAEVMVVRQFSLGSRLGVSVERVGCNGSEAGAVLR